MISLISFYSSNSPYGGNNNHSYAPKSFGGNYSDVLLNVGMKMLLIAVAKQQLQTFVSNNANSIAKQDNGGNDDSESASGKSDTQSSGQAPHHHCYSPKQESESQDEKEEDAEPNEVQALQGMINQLHQQTAHQAVMQQSHGFNSYLATSFSDQQIIRSVQLEGGRVLKQYDSFFLAEDYHGHRYSISRSSGG